MASSSMRSPRIWDSRSTGTAAVQCNQTVLALDVCRRVSTSSAANTSRPLMPAGIWSGSKSAAASRLHQRHNSSGRSHERRRLRPCVRCEAGRRDGASAKVGAWLAEKTIAEEESEEERPPRAAVVRQEHAAFGEEEEEEEEDDGDRTPIQKWLYPDKEELPDDVEMSIWDHLEELRQRIFVSVGAVGAAICLCFCFAKDIITFLEAPVYQQGVRFLALSPGEYFFTTLKVSGYCGLLVGSPVILYEVIAFVLPGLTLSERRFLGPIVLGSSVLFYAGLAFAYTVLTPAALNFFVQYSEGVVESFWSIDQYFEFVLVLLFSTGLAFQVPVIQLLLGQTGIVTSEKMLSVWKYVVVGAVVAAAVLTPSTDPLTQILLAGPLIGLYFGGAYCVKLLEAGKQVET